MDRRLLTFALLCLVSLTADMTYEGARSVIGPYLEILGASAIIAGLLTIGDLLGYVARLWSGVLVSRARSSRALWLFTIGGYAINLFSVPPLALARGWQQVLGLVIAERVGKGLRTPTRDVVLAEVSEAIGRGKGFGIHEAADQVGAIAGPIIVAAIASFLGVRHAFLWLAIPAAVSMALVLSAYVTYPHVRSIEVKGPRISIGGLVRRGRFLRFVIATILLGLGFVPWTVLSYEGARLGIGIGVLATAYALAMGVDAAIAFPAGWLYDRFGPRVMLVAPLACIAAPVLILSGSTLGLYLCAISWGACMGIMESVFRAAVAELVEPSARAAAYGLAYFLFGVAWLACGLYSGLLVQVDPRLLPLAAVGFLVASSAIYSTLGWAREG
ncbi:MAG: MFS transporter [Crenarchaeota archaeon]|nr:MFS transporter [Thermoproteota archaeon]